MALPSHQIEAFLAVARTRNFSSAAKSLGVTQSALSQRVLNLEDSLQAKLLVRHTAGVRLTDLGEELLKYGQWTERLEAEFLARLKTGNSKELAGVVRVAGFSSVVRSVLMPSLSSLIAENPKIQVEVLSREMRELPGLLRNGEVDFIFTDHLVERGGVVSRTLGQEDNILVAAKSIGTRSDIYLDHDTDDSTTERYLRLNRVNPAKVKRSFLDDIYGILDGAALGWGRAVVPRHLARNHPALRVVEGQKSLRLPVVMSYFEASHAPRLETAVLEAFVRQVPKLLR